jgi:hypothetical protein
MERDYEVRLGEDFVGTIRMLFYRPELNWGDMVCGRLVKDISGG